MKSHKVKASVIRELATYCTPSEIGAVVGICPNTASSWCRKLGITPRSKRRGTLWSAEEDALIRKLTAAGKSARIIAKKLPGRNRDMVLGRRYRLGAS